MTIDRGLRNCQQQFCYSWRQLWNWRIGIVVWVMNCYWTVVSIVGACLLGCRGIAFESWICWICCDGDAEMRGQLHSPHADHVSGADGRALRRSHFHRVRRFAMDVGANDGEMSPPRVQNLGARLRRPDGTINWVHRRSFLFMFWLFHIPNLGFRV